MAKMRRINAISLAVLAGLGTAAAQNQPDQTIRTTTRLVTVDVVASDANGPVTNLKKDDFVLRDRGEAQKISVFAQDAVATVTPKATGQPNLFTNATEGGSVAPVNITIILLDGLNTRIGDQLNARHQIERVFGTLRPRDRVAVYTLGKTLSILCDFTAEPEEVRRALVTYRSRNDSNSEATSPQPGGTTGNTKLDSMISAAAKNMADHYQVDSVRTTAASLETIANYVAPLSGRKSLIWVFRRFPVQHRL